MTRNEATFGQAVHVGSEGVKLITMVTIALCPLGTEHFPHLYRKSSVLISIPVREIVPERGDLCCLTEPNEH